MKHIRLRGFPAYFILFLIFCGVIYFYFVNIQTQTIYGDDLTQYQEQAGNTHISDIIAAGKAAYKFRPVMGIVTYIEVHLFNKWLPDYFLFNVGIQAIIAVIFTAIVNLFLRSFLLSAFIGLMAGLSRFAYYNITQLMCGGPMEGLAMIFFLAALYNLVIYLTYSNEARHKNQFYYLIRAIVFSNLAIYTHERYLVLFPVIIFFTLLHPLKNTLSLRQKLVACFLSFASIFANFALKEYVYHYRFLLGTGTSAITQDFNLKKQLGFLGDALLSIIQFNSGPEYLTGIVFQNAGIFHQILVIVAIITLCTLVFWYVSSNMNAQHKSSRDFSSSIKLVLFLLVIFLTTLAPAVSTLELEQRWLQAPFSMFILIVIIIYLNIRTQHPRRKNYLLIFFVSIFLFSDYFYMTGMYGHFWMKGAEWQASSFKDVTLQGIIRKETNTIYILEDKRNPFPEIQLSWTLRDGYFFDFYQGRSKNIIYLDSNKFSDNTQLNYLINFDKKTEQILQLKNWVAIVTDEVLKERDKYFKAHGITAKNN